MFECLKKRCCLKASVFHITNQHTLYHTQSLNANSIVNFSIFIYKYTKNCYHITKNENFCNKTEVSTLLYTESKIKDGVKMENEPTLLIERSKQGDTHAFSQLYSLYAEELFRFAVYMTGTKEDAEDAVQEAVFSAWRNIHTLKEPALFKQWMFKILSNRCKTELMKKNKRPDVLPVEDYNFLLGGEDFSFDSTELKEALSTLTPPDGQIIMLSVIGGFKSHELSDIFNMPAATVRSRQKRALEKLKTVLL